MISSAEKNKTEKGALYLVATPIGNLDDITLRALKVLRECDFVAAEDTRVTAKLLSHFEISKPSLDFNQYKCEVEDILNDMVKLPQIHKIYIHTTYIKPLMRIS